MMRDLNPNAGPPWAIAHRGFSARCPENTLPAFEAALRLEIQAIECDVQMSRDDVPVIFHDRTLSKVGGGRRRVRTQALATLKEIDVARGHKLDAEVRIPTLEEVLRAVGRRMPLLLEIKRREVKPDRREKIIDLTMALLDEYRLTDNVLILSYDAVLLKRAHQKYPQVGYVWNSDSPRLPSEMPWLSAYSVRYQGLNRDFVQQVHAQGKPVLTFTCNSTQSLNRVLALGVDGIMSDHPDWLVDQLNRRFKKVT